MVVVEFLVALAILAEPAVAEKPRRGCDVSVEFKAWQGEVDGRSFKRIMTWLDQSQEVAGYEKTERPNGSVKLCIKTAAQPNIRQMFTAASLLVDRNFGGKAAVRVENRYGGLFEKRRFKGSTRAGNPYENRHTGRPSRADLARMPRP